MSSIQSRDFYYTSQEGLRLYARDYGDRASGLTPIICLPGLTRNSKDFESVALRYAHKRRVLCPDFRGRGRSQYCDKVEDYTALTETNDMFDMMAAAGIPQAHFIGTSRGGIVTMLIATYRPNAIRSAVLNDIGPEFVAEGLKRIAETTSTPAAPESWTEAAFRLRMINERNFPRLESDDWYAWAKRLHADRNGKPEIDYDIKISQGLQKNLEAFNGQLPPLWAQFKTLGHVPVVVVRGENSDVLSAETVEKMKTEHPNLTAITVKDRGHVPFLDEPEVTTILDGFFNE